MGSLESRQIAQQKHDDLSDFAAIGRLGRPREVVGSLDHEAAHCFAAVVEEEDLVTELGNPVAGVEERDLAHGFGLIFTGEDQDRFHSASNRSCLALGGKVRQRRGAIQRHGIASIACGAVKLPILAPSRLPLRVARQAKTFRPTVPSLTVFPFLPRFRAPISPAREGV